MDVKFSIIMMTYKNSLLLFSRKLDVKANSIEISQVGQEIPNLS